MLKKCIIYSFFIFSLFLYPSYSADWLIEPPVSQGRSTGILNDIDSRMPPNHIYRDADVVTWGHETTHGVNSRLRNKYEVDNAYYLLNGRVFTIRHPNFSLSRIARETPSWMRGDIYQLYLIQQQRYWNNEPFYVIDELTSYINGAAVGLQYNRQRRTQESYENALEMLGYTFVARSIAENTRFQEQAALDSFLNYYIRYRVLWIRQEMSKRNWLKPKHDYLLKRYKVIE